MANTYTSSQFDGHDFNWSDGLWWILACAAIIIVLYAFTTTGNPVVEVPVEIEAWVP